MRYGHFDDDSLRESFGRTDVVGSAEGETAP